MGGRMAERAFARFLAPPVFGTLRIGACEGLTDARAKCCAANGGVRLFAELNSEILNANANTIAN